MAWPNAHSHSRAVPNCRRETVTEKCARYMCTMNGVDAERQRATQIQPFHFEMIFATSIEDEKKKQYGWHIALPFVVHVCPCVSHIVIRTTAMPAHVNANTKEHWP